jgi:hypothetical protein
MSPMKQSYLYNLSGRAIPDNAEISIAGTPGSDDVLVVETMEGSKGTACWHSRDELASRRRADAAIADARPSWAEPLKPKAPYA